MEIDTTPDSPQTLLTSLFCLSLSLMFRYLSSIDLHLLVGLAHDVYHGALDLLSGASISMVFVLNWKKFKALFKKK